MVRMSALIQLAQMKIQLALVQEQLAFWTQLAYNFRHCCTLIRRRLSEQGAPKCLKYFFLFYPNKAPLGIVIIFNGILITHS